MGLQQPKSLIEARDGRSFLDIIIGQTLALRRRHGVELPLVLMDSESTREPTLRELGRHPELARDGIAPDFMQSVMPKLDAETLEPVSWPAAPALEWYPPGHGDVYGALRRSGMLEALLRARLSLRDDLQRRQSGLALDTRIVAHVAEQEIPFLMEVVQGTEADRKGGHVARRTRRRPARPARDGPDPGLRRGVVPRLPALALLQHQHAVGRPRGAGGHLGEIRRRARAAADRQPQDRRPARSRLHAGDPAGERHGRGDRAASPAPRCCSCRAPASRRSRRPTISWCCAPTSTGLRRPRGRSPSPPAPTSLPYVELDKRFYSSSTRSSSGSPKAPPSLREAERLVVHGDVTFGAGVLVRGAVELEADTPTTIDAGTVLESMPDGQGRPAPPA